MKDPGKWQYTWKTWDFVRTKCGEPWVDRFRKIVKVNLERLKRFFVDYQTKTLVDLSVRNIDKL